ncbi:MAG: hypothetical protein B7Y90_18630 [Alphaproteobacteria bacterium 32-64-14]|nr:MAG: hypothetical protein B7Y90_18630 [Alphaproteobacteria bacterium 32-64-14]
MALILGLTGGASIAQQPTQQPAKQPAQQSAMDHGQASMNDYKMAMDKMQQAMMAQNDADVDRAWALKMIEHHRGAIAMSEIVLKRGDDADAKKMARKTIDMQTKDIAELEAWLTAHGGKPKS